MESNKVVFFNAKTGEALFEKENTSLYAAEMIARQSDNNIGYCIVYTNVGGRLI